MTEELPDDRAEQVARDWFAQQASGVAPGSIDPATVRAAAGRRQRRRFTGLLAAAAVLVAVLVAVPLALRPATPITGIPAVSEPTWTTTAPSPLSPRSGSVTAWLGGRFYVIGGWDGGPCPPGGMCDMMPPDLRDGASYDPAADTWQKLAEAPFTIGRDFASLAAHQDALYAISYDGDGSFWTYLPQDDRWEQLATPPAVGPLVAVGSRLMLASWDGVAAQLYDAEQDSWSSVPAGPFESCDGQRSVAAGERLLTLGRCGGERDELRIAFYSSEQNEWSDATVVPGVEETALYTVNNPVYVAGQLLWPDALSDTASTMIPGVFDTESATWREVAAGGPRGGLAYRDARPWGLAPILTGRGLVEANGNLLDVGTATWVKVPEAPVPDRWDPVVAAGRDSLLSCFGYRYTSESVADGGFAQGCYLLTLGAATPPESPTPSETAGVAAAWREVAPPDAAPRNDPLLVAADGGYYLMGGWRADPSGDDLQLRTGFRLDPVTRTWTPIAELPEPSLSHPYTMAADVVGATIYVHFRFEEMGELWAYDTAADRWRKLMETDELDYFVSTQDGLVKVLSDEGSSRLLLLSSDDQWTDLPRLPVGRRLFRLGDHQLGYVTAANQVAVLDTTTRSWQDPSEPGETLAWEYGVDGAAVFVYPPDSEGEIMPNHKYGLDVMTLVDGVWKRPELMVTDGGLGSSIGAVAGRWIVISGNLFDPRAQEWLGVPAIPGSDFQWESYLVAGGPQGVLSCFPIRDIDEPEPRPVDSCYFLTVP